jgi:hypothetical protein
VSHGRPPSIKRCVPTSRHPRRGCYRPLPHTLTCSQFLLQGAVSLPETFPFCVVGNKSDLEGKVRQGAGLSLASSSS